MRTIFHSASCMGTVHPAAVPISSGIPRQVLSPARPRQSTTRKSRLPGQGQVRLLTVIVASSGQPEPSSVSAAPAGLQGLREEDILELESFLRSLQRRRDAHGERTRMPGKEERCWEGP